MPVVPEALALHQRIEQMLLIEPERRGGLLRELLQHLTLAVAALEIEDDPVRSDDVGNLDHSDDRTRLLAPCGARGHQGGTIPPHEPTPGRRIAASRRPPAHS